MLITSYKPEGEGHNHDVSGAIRRVLFRRLFSKPDPVAEACRKMQDWHNEYEKIFEKKVKSVLGNYTVEQLMNLDFEIVNLEPIVTFSKVGERESKIEIGYRNVDIVVSNREEPRTAEDAQNLYDLIHERR